jgi:hypothetical protein
MLAAGADHRPRSFSVLFTIRGHIPNSDILASHVRSGARTKMSLKHRTTEQWMRIGFTILVLVGVIWTLLIVVVRLK